MQWFSPLCVRHVWRTPTLFFSYISTNISSSISFRISDTWLYSSSTHQAVNSWSPIESLVSLWSCRFEVRFPMWIKLSPTESIFIVDIQAVAHGHYCHYRRTGQPTVVQYSMLHVSCPSGNPSTKSSFARQKRSTSSRYKKYRQNLISIHPLENHPSHFNISINSI